MGIRDLFTSIRRSSRVSIVGASLLDSTSLAIAQRRFPEDVRNLLWFSDGPLCNYSPEDAAKSFSSADGLTLTVLFSLAVEPSAISVAVPVAALAPGEVAEPLGYYPTYEGMSRHQRWVYLNWLMDVDGPVDIGYVFVFYYGLERQLFGELADEAVDMILRLRAHHVHRSFTRYSSDALLAASLVASRPDWLVRFAETIGSVGDVALSDVYLYAKYRHGFDLSPLELMALSDRVGFKNRRYIKGETSLFEQALGRLILAECGSSGLPLSRYEFADCPLSMQALFANTSLDRDRTLLAVPSMAGQPVFREEVASLLAAAHEDVKQQLKSARAARDAESRSREHRN
jgi:hypothetical protein